MIEPAVSKSNPPVVDLWHRILRAAGQLRQLALWILFIGCVMLVTFVVLRIRVTYHVQQELALLRAEHKLLIDAITNNNTVCTERLNVVEQTLFGEVLPTQKRLVIEAAPAAPPHRVLSRIEIYQQNTNKELRARLESIERWRFEMERRFHNLR